VFLPGGMLIPLELLPRPLELISFALPFATMAYVPGRIASGHPDPLLLLWQLGWLAVLLGMAGAVFAAGERRLQVMGGSRPSLRPCARRSPTASPIATRSGSRCR
jgi:ABC-type uncharacterized transport system permease subunit